MRKFSKILSLLLAIVMAFSLCSASVFAEDAAEDLYYYRVMYTTRATTEEHPLAYFYYAAHGVQTNGQHEVLDSELRSHELEENDKELTTEIVFTSPNPITGIKLLSDGVDDSDCWTLINDTANESGTQYFIELDPAQQQPGIDNAVEIEEAYRIEGFADGGAMLLSENLMDAVFEYEYEDIYYYCVVPITTRTDSSDHPTYDFTYTGYPMSVDMVDPYEKHTLEDGETSVTKDVYFYSREPLTELTVAQMYDFNEEWTHDSSEYHIEIDPEVQQKGMKNALRIDQMSLYEYDEDGDAVLTDPQDVVFNVSYAELPTYYYEIALPNFVDGKGAEYHAGAEIVIGYQARSVMDDTILGYDTFDLAPTDFEEEYKFELSSYGKLDTLMIEFMTDDPEYDWDYSEAQFVLMFDGSEDHSTDPEKPMRITKMYQVRNDAGDVLAEGPEDLESMEQVKIEFNHVYDFEGDYVEYEIPIVVDIEQAGTAAPGKATFTFEVWPNFVGAVSLMSAEAEVETEVVRSEDPMLINAYVTTNGAGEHSAVLKIRLLDYMDTDQFYIVQLPGDDPHWTYDETEYFMAKRYRYEALSEGNDSGEWYIESYNPNTGECEYELDQAVFHNVYDYSPAVVTEDTYTIIAKSGNHGEISPEGEVTVKEGRDKTFEFTPDKGYEVSRIVIDGEELPKRKISDTYTFEDVDADHTIKVYFSKIKEEVPAEDEVEEVNPNTGAI